MRPPDSGPLPWTASGAAPPTALSLLPGTLSAHTSQGPCSAPVLAPSCVLPSHPLWQEGKQAPAEWESHKGAGAKGLSQGGHTGNHSSHLTQGTPQPGGGPPALQNLGENVNPGTSGAQGWAAPAHFPGATKLAVKPAPAGPRAGRWRQARPFERNRREQQEDQHHRKCDRGGRSSILEVFRNSD